VTQGRANGNSAPTAAPVHATPGTLNRSNSAALVSATHGSSTAQRSPTTSGEPPSGSSQSSPSNGAPAQPEVRLINRQVPAGTDEKPQGDVKLFAPEGSAEGCASGECLPEAPAAVTPPAPMLELAEPEDEPEPPPPVAPTNRSVGTDEDKWRRAVDALRDVSPRHGKSLSYARFLGFTPEGVRIAFSADAAFHRSQVISMSRPMVEGELTKSLGRPIKIVEETNAQAFQTAPKSIAEVEATDRSTRERGIEDKVKAHPALRNVLRHLGGSLEHISYLEPVARQPAAGPSTPDEGDAGPAVD
jgi:hypothetical protein